MSAQKKLSPRRGVKASGHPLKRQAVEFLETNSVQMIALSQRIWQTPELSLEEYRSSAFLVEELQEAGFRVDTELAGLPTSFVGRWGRGRPNIGIIAEYDAVPHCGPKETDNGHGCGHNLFGTASVSAGIAVKKVLETSGARGTIKVFGTPAEEILLGKVLMVKAGVFDGLDAVLSWHPGEGNLADYSSCKSLNSITFEFFGKSAHAQIDPEMSQSALGAIELMNEGVNRLRGQVPPGTGFHYVIPEAGQYPGVILPYAKSWYWIWTPSRTQTEEVTAKVKKIAQGAARATGTRARIKLCSGTYQSLPNLTLGGLIDQNLKWVGAPRFTHKEKALARRLGFKEPLREWVDPPREGFSPYANDQGNVSWVTPLGLFYTSCRAPKTPEHSWPATCQFGSGIGFKGMKLASKVLACTALDLICQPTTLRKIQKEFREKTQGFEYRSPI